MADLRVSSGLGSSSIFTVGCLNSLNYFEGLGVALRDFAMDAINIKTRILGKQGGWRDQLHACFGGFRLYGFYSGSVSPVDINFDLDFLSSLWNLLCPCKIGATQADLLR